MNTTATVTATVISADGTTIAYDRVGTGPAVILVGGAFQYRSFDPRTAEIATALSERFTVFHYDRRGRGDSGDIQPYAVGREVEDIAALIDAAGGRACLYGMSSGAPLALDAVAAGLDVPKIAVYEAPFLVDGGRAVGPGYPRTARRSDRGRRPDRSGHLVPDRGRWRAGRVRRGHARAADVAGVRGGRADTGVRRTDHGRHGGRSCVAGDAVGRGDLSSVD
ncbi:MAG TPA: alpha/beta hydrolase, partial [Micromonosporaceae bacterium]|nr:alpha/beta hydrolase [Micromonosporaceae bacterium]